MSKKQKESLQSLIDKADAYYKSSDFDNALQFYEKAIALNLQSAESWNGKGLTLVPKGQLDLDLSCYKKDLEIDNSIALIWNNIGTYYFSNKRV